ncbi:hypothetical protein BBJ28_00016137 [Nothophytophthora sp. Chile5]|nr:hypothetical protein BBJ28_00016137 [Nothophytophthora sp. Chile5]
MESAQQRRPMFAMVCVNNVNRSAAAHGSLSAAGLRVCSFGAGRQVSFPGKTSADARTFKFQTPYEAMHRILLKEDPQLFTANGVLKILERDMPLKKAPERWQSLNNKQLIAIDVVVCLDYIVADGSFFRTNWVVLCLVADYGLSDLQMRIRLSFKHKRLHVICLDTADTPEDASSGSISALQLCQELDVPACELTEERVKTVVQNFEKEHGRQMFYLGLHM